jgi:hypothetical protein
MGALGANYFALIGLAGANWDRIGTGGTQMSFATDGSISLGAGVTGPASWGSPITAGIGNNWAIRVTVTAGTFSGGATGAWLPLSTIRTYTCNAPLSSSKSVTFTLEYSQDGGATVFTAYTGLTLTNDRNLN